MAPTRKSPAAKHSSRITGRSTPADLLSRFSPHVVALCEHIRGVVKAEVPTVEEIAYLGWKTINFREAGRQFGYLALHPDRVHLGFDKGVLLDDPQGLLEGQAKMARSIRIEASGSIKDAAIRGLIRDAVRLNALAPKIAHKRGSTHSGKAGNSRERP